MFLKLIILSLEFKVKSNLQFTADSHEQVPVPNMNELCDGSIWKHTVHLSEEQESLITYLKTPSDSQCCLIL